MTGLPLVVVARKNGAQVILSSSSAAEAAGVGNGLLLQDALAICSDLVARPADDVADAEFLSNLRRLAIRYAPTVAEDGKQGLMLDATGCTHLFNGDHGMLKVIATDFSALGLTCRTAIADTVGAAWALAHFDSCPGRHQGDGRLIDHQTRATRSRASRRQIGPAPRPVDAAPYIAPPGNLLDALAPLPVDALRLPLETVGKMKRLGLNRVGDIAHLPRKPFVRRFGTKALQLLDQAFGRVSETVSTTPLPTRFSARLTLPEPIGREDDIMAAIDRILARICKKLHDSRKGAYRFRIEFRRIDGEPKRFEVGLARPTNRTQTVRSLILLKLPGIDVGFGVDRIRLEALSIENDPDDSTQRLSGLPEEAQAESGDLADLISRIGARVGPEAVTRLHPADSHIPEKSFSVRVAAWSKPASSWPMPERPRPALLFFPEPVEAAIRSSPPSAFRWRRRDFQRISAIGPERIMPEWWLDDPQWFKGTRDYWRIETHCGRRLWLFFAHGGMRGSAGWFCHGDFG